MRKIIIAATSDFSSVMLDIIRKEKQADVMGFTINENCINEKEKDGLPIIAFERLKDCFDMDEVEILLTFGYSNLNALRKKMYAECKANNFRVATFISKEAHIYSESIGEGTIILPNVYVGPFCDIGRCNIIWNSVNICHHNRVGDFNNIAAGATLAGNVEIGDNCFVGVNCALKNGIIIANQNLISAGSYVSKTHCRIKHIRAIQLDR